MKIPQSTPVVIPALVAGIHFDGGEMADRWIAGTSPAMTNWGENKKAGIAPGLGQSSVSDDYEHPLVLPQVSHLRHVPLRTMV